MHIACATRISAETIGVDAISMDGFECAGHPGEDDVPGLMLIPAAADELTIPIDRLGRHRRRRGLVAAWRSAPRHQHGHALHGHQGGADPSERKGGHRRRRRALHRADLPHVAQHARVFGNAVAKKAIEMEQRGKGIDEIGPYVAGKKGRVVYETGDLEHGIWSAGTSMGLIQDIPSCKELVERIVSEAEAIIKARLVGMAASARGHTSRPIKNRSM